MDTVLRFLAENWPSLAFLAAIAVGIALLLRFGCVREAKAILLALVTEAEARFGGGMGAVKYSAVAAALYAKLPAAAKFLLREKTVAALIEAAVEKMKRCLSDKETDGGVTD